MKKKRDLSYNYETLARLLTGKRRKGMDINAILEMFGHLDECEVCRDALYQISRENDAMLFIRSARRA